MTHQVYDETYGQDAYPKVGDVYVVTDWQICRGEVFEKQYGDFIDGSIPLLLELFRKKGNCNFYSGFHVCFQIVNKYHNTL